jgi:DNA-binding response OmpR family regulator
MEQASATVLVYSDDRNVREQVRLAAGRRPAADVPQAALDQGGIDVCVLDGEAVPSGGMGICRQLKDEIFRCPPVLLLIGRPQDTWLATWSRADAVVTHPIDPVALTDALAGLLRDRMAALSNS